MIDPNVAAAIPSKNEENSVSKVGRETEGKEQGQARLIEVWVPATKSDTGRKNCQLTV